MLIHSAIFVLGNSSSLAKINCKLIFSEHITNLHIIHTCKGIIVFNGEEFKKNYLFQDPVYSIKNNCGRKLMVWMIDFLLPMNIRLHIMS